MTDSPPDLLTLPLSEVFGPTIQGEGPAAGRSAWFLRLGGCNLACSWCDTAYTWDASRYDLRREIRHTEVQEIISSLPMEVLVIVTGGEPLLQQDQASWRELLERLRDRGCDLHLETNGTIEPNAVSRALVELFVVSPKLANAGSHRGHQQAGLHPGWTAVAQDGQAELKVVCTSASDVAEVRQLADQVGWPRRGVWVMPEGTTQEVLGARWPVIVDAAATHGLNATHRLHVLAWNEKRGH
ncbi:7-carboxy-7-deazaguanine synthase QueE [Kribbella sp. CA-293567]|uniref:7-carboxy-7-deazaguanine synthase QueE n=1 Tax=Kribbella sp. CA-293567 TaxID=3002436 RepID=UPI0022DE1F7D|nr:7-carboxy-7-deazaguanine synthase QueE [Kribbella sp. CA-293567]WBQ07614.1 7-carboxy-7-deazaguanine synthase QueE [Kribbella sp. CA-293567]